MEAPKPATQQMTAPAPSVPRLVKIRANTAIRLTGTNQMLSPGQTGEVSEEDAKEFCDKIFVGNFGISGMFPDGQAEAVRHRLRRADRV